MSTTIPHAFNSLWSGSDLIWWTEGYERKPDALNAIRIAKASYNAPVKDMTQRAA